MMFIWVNYFENAGITAVCQVIHRKLSYLYVTSYIYIK